MLLPLVAGSALLIVRGVPGFVEALLMATRVAPEGLLAAINDTGQPAATTTDWTAIAINSYFFAGALLLVPTTAAYARRSARRRR